MRTGEFINATEEALLHRDFNIFFGFSIGNKYFTPERIRAYLEWALEHTKDKVAVLIPDKIHAVNYEVKNRYAPQRALSVALRKGTELEQVVRTIIADLNIPDSKIRVIHWQEVEDQIYLENLQVICRAFREDAAFRETVVNMTKEAPQLKDHEFSAAEYERLAEYIINELPVLLVGLAVEGEHFDLLPYPGLANLDYLALDLQEGRTFPHITEKLKIQKRLAIVELYVD